MLNFVESFPGPPAFHQEVLTVPGGKTGAGEKVDRPGGLSIFRGRDIFET